MNKLILNFLVLSVVALPASFVMAQTNTNRISVTVSGKGPDVVLIPGLASSAAVWNATVQHLESQYRVHLVQVAGFAGAPAGPNASGEVVQPTVDAIDAYVRAHNLKAPAVIGHSLGGLMGLMLAQQHPDDVAKLMIVDSLPFFSVIMGSTNAADAAPRAAQWRDNVIAQSQEAFEQSQAQLLSVLVKSPQGYTTATNWSAKSDRSVVARALYEVMTTDVRGKLSQVKIPVTILYPWAAISGQSPEGSGRIYRDNYEPLPNKKFVRIDDSYHFIMLDQPEAFWKAVDAFLE
jgi:pimeloyl-ACP methyl ester carboxylesterase